MKTQISQVLNFFYVYAHVYAIMKVGSFSEENGKKRWRGPAKITIKNT